MKPPSPEGLPRIDVSTAELEALLEQGRPSLGEDGYQKLRAAIRTLGYVTELLEKQETTLQNLRELLCPASTEKTEKVLKQAGMDTGEKKTTRCGELPEKTRTWAQRRCRLSRSEPSGSVARVIKDGRPMSGCAVQRQSLRATRSWGAGADQRAGAAGRDRLRVGKAEM
jgi:hypothetical protein